jgi:1-acyl-sn-glycerol-3-phosphate acyltransferase
MAAEKTEQATTSFQAETRLPPYARHLHGWFMWYVRRFLRRHFHAIRLLQPEAGDPAVPVIEGEPVLLYTNHPGWWDPLIFLTVAERLYPERLNYGPIDASALGRYSFLERIGFLGIEPDSFKGAARFLRLAKAAMHRSDVLFWVTAQGTFADPRQRPVTIRPGVGHVAAAADKGLVIPLAVEYPFWGERLPEALVAFGPPQRIADFPSRDAHTWHDHLTQLLADTQDRLASAAITRDPQSFNRLATGRTGVGGVYDLFRRLQAWLTGKHFDPAHVREQP